ncbi:MAG: dienelactone hydrolase family protein [Pseudomonadota bacterium]
MRGVKLHAVLAAVCFAVSPVRAADIQKCSMVANGEGRVLTYEGQSARGKKVAVDGILTKPGGDGPFPLVIMLPGDGGLVTPYCNGRWARKFSSWGYASLVVAVTTGRDEHGERLFQYSYRDVSEYARFIAATLIESSDIDSARIGLWGFSRGGLSALELATDADFPGGAFKASIAFAPHCPSRSQPPQIPALVIQGTADAVISADVCIQYAKRMTDRAGFQFVVLDGGKHVFWLEEPHASTATSVTKSFLAKHL